MHRLLRMHTPAATIPIISTMQTVPPTMALTAAMGNEVGGLVVVGGREGGVETIGEEEGKEEEEE